MNIGALSSLAALYQKSTQQAKPVQQSPIAQLLAQAAPTATDSDGDNDGSGGVNILA